MDYGIYTGDTDQTIYARLRDSTTGLAATGLLYTSPGIALTYILPRSTPTAITPATQTVTGAHSDGGFVEISPTIAKGLYRLDLPDAAIASGSYSLVSVQFSGIITEDILIPLHTRKVNVTQIKGSTTTVDNIEIVFNTDFSSNYDTTVDAWVTSVQYWSGDSVAAAVFGSIPSHVYSFDTGAIDAAAIADGAIDAATFAADVDAEILSYIWSATFPEPTGVPNFNSPASGWMGWLGALSRNRIEQSETMQTLYNDVQSTGIATSNISDDGSLFIRDEWV